MKKNLLQITQDILSALDSENVNSISDSVEALQVAKVVQEVFEDMIATRHIPSNETLLKLTSLSDSSKPTHFELQDDETKIKHIWYDISNDNSFKYREIQYLEPSQFLRRIDHRQEDLVVVDDPISGTKLRIKTNSQPSFYTSFDNRYIVFDSYKSDIDSTLQASKIRAIGTTFPAFSISDTYTPDIDAALFPYLVREATSRCFSIFKGMPDQKTEQAARRQKVHVQNDKYRLQAPDKRRHYGRR